jgi:hypothetical protein
MMKKLGDLGSSASRDIQQAAELGQNAECACNAAVQVVRPLPLPVVNLSSSARHNLTAPSQGRAACAGGRIAAGYLRARNYRLLSGLDGYRQPSC